MENIGLSPWSDLSRYRTFAEIQRDLGDTERVLAAYRVGPYQIAEYAPRDTGQLAGGREVHTLNFTVRKFTTYVSGVWLSETFGTLEAALAAAMAFAAEGAPHHLDRDFMQALVRARVQKAQESVTTPQVERDRALHAYRQRTRTALQAVMYEMRDSHDQPCWFALLGDNQPWRMADETPITRPDRAALHSYLVYNGFVPFEG
jgi:hypothetical protein